MLSIFDRRYIQRSAGNVPHEKQGKVRFLAQPQAQPHRSILGVPFDWVSPEYLPVSRLDACPMQGSRTLAAPRRPVPVGSNLISKSRLGNRAGRLISVQSLSHSKANDIKGPFGMARSRRGWESWFANGGLQGRSSYSPPQRQGMTSARRYAGENPRSLSMVSGALNYFWTSSALCTLNARETWESIPPWLQ
ncbi:hypothetical protein BDW71DRAFT_127568 [Aspergillus fruticulosus]